MMQNGHIRRRACPLPTPPADAKVAVAPDPPSPREAPRWKRLSMPIPSVHWTPLGTAEVIGDQAGACSASPTLSLLYLRRKVGDDHPASCQGARLSAAKATEPAHQSG